MLNSHSSLCLVQSYLILFPKTISLADLFLHTKWQRNVQYIFIKMCHFPLKCTNCPFKCTSFTLKGTNVTQIYNFLTKMFDVLPRILNFYPWNISFLHSNEQISPNCTICWLATDCLFCVEVDSWISRDYCQILNTNKSLVFAGSSQNRWVYRNVLTLGLKGQ